MFPKFCSSFRRNFKISIFFTLCLMFLANLFLFKARAEAQVYFDPPLKFDALQNYFKQKRGSYFIENELLWKQAVDGLEVDFSARGQAILSWPYLGQNSYLDAGSGYFYPVLPTDGVALIVSPSGKIFAAAFYWSSCSTECIESKYNLTIFLKSTENRKRYSIIFENWAKRVEAVEYAQAHFHQSSVDFSDSNSWAEHEVKSDIPSDVVYINEN